MLAPNGTISVTSKDNAFHPWVFRAMTSDALNTKVMFERATAGGAKRLAIMHQEDAYGKETADYIERLAKEKGIEVVTVASAPMRAIDLVAQATKVRNAEPDVVLMQIGPVGLATGFLRAAKQVGIKAPLWGGMGLGYNAFIQIGGDAAEGARLVVVGNFDDPSPGLKELGALLQKAGKKPEGWAEVIGTNGLLAIVEAAKQVKGPITGAAIRDQLEKLCGVTNYSQGKVCYSADNHDGYGSDLLLGVEVRNGKFNVVN
jgi:branched-chain amino acid transport system substrate-binding protein